jgi:hypothetical protein
MWPATSWNAKLACLRMWLAEAVQKCTLYKIEQCTKENNRAYVSFPNNPVELTGRPA